VIRAPTPTVWVIGRTLVRGPDDLSAAVAISSQYRLIPLDKYGTDYIPPSNVPVTNPEPQFIPPEGQPATAAEGFAEPIFFQAMQSVIAANPPPLNQRPLGTQTTVTLPCSHGVRKTSRQIAREPFISAEERDDDE